MIAWLKTRTGRAVAASAVVALVAVVAIVAISSYGAQSRGTEAAPLVLVPDLAGQTDSSATAAGEALGFVIEIVRDADADVPAGTVIGTEPAGAAELSAGSPLVIHVSDGPPLVAVPDVVEMTEEDATVALAAVTLAAPTVSQDYSDDVAEGLIISQEPEAGTLVAEGSTVAAVVSLGPSKVKVPKVVGLGKGKAKKKLEAAGFTVAIKSEYSVTVSSGVVTRQDPKKGHLANTGGKVTIYVSKGQNTALLRSWEQKFLGMIFTDAKKLGEKSHITVVNGHLVDGMPTPTTYKIKWARCGFHADGSILCGVQ